MKKADAMIFIDTNQYLDLYALTAKKKKTLELLTAQQEYIFVTSQVVEEVQRNKVRIMATQVGELLETLPTWTKVAPLVNLSKEELKGLKLTKKAVVTAAALTLERISKSEDELSITLDKLFSKAHCHTPDELQRARDRKERGNPPGKGNKIGDELSWEQLLSHYKGESKLWIITKDLDFCTKIGSQSILNAFLHQELLQRNAQIKVFCFHSLAQGIEHFTDTTGKNREKRIPPEEVEEIKKEQESLPPWGWNVQARYEPVLWHHYYRNWDPVYYTDVSAGSPAGRAGWLANSTLPEKDKGK
jgi:predicted nucleic acid-binding protein